MKKVFITFLFMFFILILPYGVNAETNWNGILNNSSNISSTTFQDAIYDDNISNYGSILWSGSAQITFIEPINFVSFSLLRSNVNGNFGLKLYDSTNTLIFTQTYTGNQDRVDLTSVAKSIKKIEIFNTDNTYTTRISEFEIYKSNDYTPPTVISINPINNSTNVQVNTNVLVNFSENIDLNSLANCTINGVGCTKSVNGTMLTLNPIDDLLEGTQYTVTIDGVKDLNDNVLASTYTSKFTTYVDVLPPFITSISPTNNSINIPVNSTVNINFNEFINPLSIQDCEIQGIPCNISSSGSTLIIRPNITLAYDTEYTATIKSIKDLKGNMMPDIHTIKFTTEQDIRPIEVLNIIPPPDTTDVPTDTEILVQFNKSNLDLSTIDGVKLLDGETEIPTTKSLINDTISLILQSDLENQKTYYISIDGIKDVIGNTMVTPINVSFQTVSDTSPFSVLSIKPPMSSTVGLSEEIIVEFNKNILPSSISFNLSDKDGNNVSAIQSIVGKKFTLKPVHLNNQSYTFRLLDATDVYGNHILTTNELTYETIKTTGDTDIDGVFSKIFNIFKNTKYFGLIIIGSFMSIAFIFLIAKWLWKKLVDYMLYENKAFCIWYSGDDEAYNWWQKNK